MQKLLLSLIFLGGSFASAQEYIMSSNPFENSQVFRDQVAEKFETDSSFIAFQQAMSGKNWRAISFNCTGADGKSTFPTRQSGGYYGLHVEFASKSVIQKDVYKKSRGLTMIANLEYDWFNVNVLKQSNSEVLIKGSFKANSRYAFSSPGIGRQEIEIMKDPNHMKIDLPLRTSEIHYTYYKYSNNETLTLTGVKSLSSSDGLCKLDETVEVIFALY